MKLIKYLWLIVALVALGACSDENAVTNGKGGGSPIPDGAVAVMLKFPGRTLVPKTYAGTYPADATEKSIGNVRILIFDDSNGQPGKLIGTEPVEITSGASAQDTEVGVSARFFLRFFGKLHMVAVANLPFNTEDYRKWEGNSFDKVSKTLITQPAGTANAFAMASQIEDIEVPQPTASGITLPKALNFILERLSARIDIENLTTTDGGELELTGARIFKGDIDRSFLIRGQVPALKIGDPTYGAVELPNNGWVEKKAGGDPKKMEMQLYTYENVAHTVIVQVKGNYKGHPAQFDIPFGAKEVKRNTRYVVKVRNASAGNKLTFEVVVKDWDEGGMSTLIPGTDTSIPTITAIAATTQDGTATSTPKHTLTYATPGNVNTVNAITLNEPGAYYTKITVESPSMESMIYINKADVPWLTVKELGHSSIEGGKLHQEFLVSYGANADLYDRTAQLEIQNKYASNKTTPKLINITQKAAIESNNRLAYLANANIDEVNTFATAITEDNCATPQVMGKYYQWGRNAAMTRGATTDVIEYSNGNDAILWDKTKLLQRNFYTTRPTTSDTWAGMVAKATSAPAWYRGNNGGDPSPVGWKIPESYELLAMLPGLNLSNESRQGFLNGSNISERIKIGATATDYKADYYTPKRYLYYALKMKSADNAHLTAYRYEYRGINGFRITARYLGAAGAGTTVQQIADPAWWNTNAGSDVVRILPSAGALTNKMDQGGGVASQNPGTSGWLSCSDIIEATSITFEFHESYPVFYYNVPGNYATSLRPIRVK